MESDYFKTTVYYAKAIDAFLIVDRGGKPRRRDHVIVARGAGRIAAERYRGQRHFGVVRILHFYEMRDSSQYEPRDIFPRELAC